MKDLNLLLFFEALWRDRSVTAAAESLDLSQGAVSTALKRLRLEYGDKLFAQVGRRMEPTSHAEMIAPQLLDALALVRATGAERTYFDPRTSTRTFTIRTRDIGEVVCFPTLIQYLREAAPGVQIRSVFPPMKETVAGLASGHIDIALGFLPSLETGIHATPLYTQDYVCVMRAGHPAAGAKMTQEQFFELEHLLVENSGSGHRELERALIRAGARHKIKVRQTQYLSAPWLLTGTDLIWTAPAILADILSRTFPLAITELPIKLDDFGIAIYWHERYHQDPANKWFRGVLTNLFQKK
jgi:DNA-binding transcriptional LysR family regulator